MDTVQEYLQSLEGGGKKLLSEFLGYMDENYPQLKPVMFRQRPMYKTGKSYVYFTVAKEHFSVHTLNFELIERLKQTLATADFGKGCVKVRFADEGAVPVLKRLCDDIVSLNISDNPPEPGFVPDLPYGQKLRNTFKGSKAKWLPLYTELLERVKPLLPEFTEYFPAVNVLWKHKSTFAQISAVSSAMRIELYFDTLRAERKPLKTLQTSKNRTAHVFEVTDNSNFGEISEWIVESYELTRN